jgi:hypothetical protein
VKRPVSKFAFQVHNLQRYSEGEGAGVGGGGEDALSASTSAADGEEHEEEVGELRVRGPNLFKCYFGAALQVESS